MSQTEHTPIAGPPSPPRRPATLQRAKRGPVPSTPAAPVEPPAEPREQVTVLIPASVRHEARAAFRELAYRDESIRTFADYVAGALVREAARIAEAYRDGEPFEPRVDRLKPGRRVD